MNFAQRMSGKVVRYVSELLGAAHRPQPLVERVQSIHDHATAAGFGDNDVKALLLYYYQCAAEYRPDR